MKLRLLSFLILLIGFQPIAKSDEGMWLPLFIERLNYVDMQKMGLQLTAEEIYSINNSSLKDAIAIFGRGCTSEIISDQGLLLTNHHCGYGRIQAHSSLEHDYLSDGFWAENLEDELPNPQLTTRFLVRIEDVTEKMLAEVNFDMTEEERAEIINGVAEEIEKDAKGDTHYECSVRGFFEGNEYYLFIYEVFKDVRLVGAPPSSIGKFGADTDNWMWPRHTGDFSLFRVYTDKDGNPAEYSEDNIPMKPKHHLPVSLAGVKKGDFSMILGYPGGTDRYMTSYGVKMILDIYSPAFVAIRDRKLNVMMEDMQSNPEIRIKYATKYARLANYWKYYIGQSKGLKKLKVYDKKQQLQKEFADWVNADQKRKDKYGEALNYIAQAYKKLSDFQVANIYQREAITRGSEILGLADRFISLKDSLNADANEENVNEVLEGIKGRLDNYFKDYNASTDQKLLAAVLDMYAKNVPENQQPEYFKKVASKYKGNFVLYAEDVFSKSNFVNRKNVDAILDNPSVKTIEKDPAFKMVEAFNDFYEPNIKDPMKEANILLDKGNRLFVAGLREMYPDKKFYPDANFTMRLTYGTVQDYYPEDAVHFNYFTTLRGVMEKEDPNNWEFVVPEKLKELYQNKDYGKYGEGDVMKLCFLTDHDITGGNSGSPVINGKGELIGLAFDGNWEAMSGDIAFEPALQRTINVDIRYVLFIIDKFAGAKRLIDEMTIVEAKRSAPEKEILEKAEKEIPVEN